MSNIIGRLELWQTRLKLLKILRPKANKNGSAKVKIVDVNSEITEAQALEELTRLAWSINTRLERIHDGLQDVIRDMRAMRGSDSP